MVAVLAGVIVGASVAGDARASPRFGESTWVAPGAPFDPEFAGEGPRVAIPDHERRWEKVLRAPFRLVFYPVRLLAQGLELSADYVGPRYLAPKPERRPDPGPKLRPRLTQGSGWDDTGVGPAITWNGFPNDHSRFYLTGTWSPIDRRRVHLSQRIGMRRPVGFLLRVDYDYKPNRRYYGIGNDTPEADLSYFLLARTNAEATLLLGASPLHQLRFAFGVSSMSPSRGYNDEPLLEDVFAPEEAPFARRTTQQLWYGIAADLAKLDDGRDPSRGVHGRIDLRRVTGVRAVDPDYTQWRVEGRAYLPVFAKRRVIAVRGVYTGVEPDGGDTSALPYYRLAQSDGINRFAGYAAARFRDDRLLLARVEYRWMILHRMSALALYELGEVAPRADAFTLRDAHVSWGGGFRFGVSDESAFRFEIATGDDGPHALLALGGDF